MQSQLQTHFIVIEAGMKHLGDQPTSIGGGTFVGDLYYAKFNLPDNVEPNELSVIQCRTRHNQKSNKRFFINIQQLGNILEPHPNNKDEWMMDISVVPKDFLKPGENSVHIGYGNADYDDFIVDNIVLWYKTKS